MLWRGTRARPVRCLRMCMVAVTGNGELSVFKVSPTTTLGPQVTCFTSSRMFPFFSTFVGVCSLLGLVACSRFVVSFCYISPICMLRIPVANMGHRFIDLRTRHIPESFRACILSFVRFLGTRIWQKPSVLSQSGRHMISSAHVSCAVSNCPKLQTISGVVISS